MEEHKDIETKLRKEIEARWDYERLEQDIVKSQKRRLFVQEALLKGEWTGWDHRPQYDSD